MHRRGERDQRTSCSSWLRDERLALDAFDSKGESVAAAHAEGGDTAFQVAVLERVEQRRENPAAARTDRVAERDCAAVDVDPARLEAEFVEHGHRLNGERFVQLPKVDVLQLPADLLRQPPYGF